MTEDTLTDDEQLRALAALEAISANEDGALTVLADSRPGERPLPALLATYGQHNIQRILLVAFGADPGMNDDETARIIAEINADPQAQLAGVLTDTLRQWAAMAGGDPAVAKVIGGAVLNAINAFTEEDDTPTLLRALRQEVLKAG